VSGTALAYAEYVPESERSRRHESTVQADNGSTSLRLVGAVPAEVLGSVPARGQGLGGSAAEMLPAWQRAAGNNAVQRALIQRDPEGPAQTADKPGAEAAGAASAPPQASTQPAAATAAINLSALYENVPGEAKDVTKRAKGDEALWFDPLRMFSNHPSSARSVKAVGVVAGGQETINNFSAPITTGDKPIGRGSISAELKYAAARNKSFNVAVSGVPESKRRMAEAAARKVIETEIETLGDVEDVAKIAQDKLRETEAYKEAVVAITTVKDKVLDAGQSTFFYKIRGPADILMEVQVVPVGEKQTRYSGSKTAGKSSEDESHKSDKASSESEKVKRDTKSSEKKTDTSTESVNIEYNEAVVRTLDDYVKKSTDVHNEVAKDLSEQVVKDRTLHEHGDTKTSNKKTQVEDYTKNVKKGQKDDENWAAKIKKGIGIAKKVTSIPWIDKIPGVGWFTRRVKGWQLDVAEWIADQFAETGKVDYEDTTIKKESTTKDEGKTTEDKDLKEHDVETTKSKLTEDFKSKMQEDWERHLKDVQNIAKTYKSLTKKDSSSTDDKSESDDYSRDVKKDESATDTRHKAAENQSTTTTFEVSQTWKFTAPVVKATVQNGDAEVSNVPFGPDPDEKSAKP
jgi:hypothetical protein